MCLRSKVRSESVVALRAAQTETVSIEPPKRDQGLGTWPLGLVLRRQGSECEGRRQQKMGAWLV